MAARTFALPTLARSAIRATGRVHFPVAAASFRMTASTAIALYSAKAIARRRSISMLIRSARRQCS
jgi:hypothetical protein